MANRLSEVSTAELVEELQSRVNTIVVPPYEPYQVIANGNTLNDSGPTVLLVVKD